MKRPAIPRPSLGFVVRALGACAVIALAVLFWRSGALDAFKPDQLAETRAWAQAKFEENPALVLAGFILLYGVLTGLGLPLAAALSLLSGAVFGAWLGGAMLVVASTLAAVVGYWIAKSVLLDLAPAGARKNPSIARFVRVVGKDPFMVILAARLMPLLPFNAINLAAGLASVPLKAYVPATFLGVIPTSLIFAALGSGLGDTLEDRASLMHAAKSPGVWGPVLALAVLSTAAVVVRLRRKDG